MKMLEKAECNKNCRINSCRSSTINKENPIQSQQPSLHTRILINEHKPIQQRHVLADIEISKKTPCFGVRWSALAQKNTKKANDFYDKNAFLEKKERKKKLAKTPPRLCTFLLILRFYPYRNKFEKKIPI